jgi:hypothetical protein
MSAVNQQVSSQNDEDEDEWQVNENSSKSSFKSHDLSSKTSSSSESKEESKGSLDLDRMLLEAEDNKDEYDDLKVDFNKSIKPPKL